MVEEVVLVGHVEVVGHGADHGVEAAVVHGADHGAQVAVVAGHMVLAGQR